MLHEAELFVMAEVMLVEVLTRVGPQDEGIVLPAIATGAGRPLTIAQAVELHVQEDRCVPQVLAGVQGELVPEPPAVDRAPPVQAAAAQAARTPAGQAARTACAAARAVHDGQAVVHCAYGSLPAREFLLRSTVARSLLAHYVAAYLGSTACPLPEELARPLHELTSPDAQAWRSLGWFHEPMDLPDHVSWRDRFLLTAGHEPHPLGH